MVSGPQTFGGFSASGLPPGSFGPPIVGEMKEFTADPRGFVWERYREHGRIFKTFLGQPFIFMMGAEANKAFLQTYNAHLTWGKALPKYVQKILSDKSKPGTAPSPADTFAMEDGEPMRRMKQIASIAFHPAHLTSTVRFMNGQVDDTLKQWSHMGTVNFYEEVKLMMFRIIWAWITGAEEDPDTRQLIEKTYQVFTAIPDPEQKEELKKLLIQKHFARLSIEEHITRLVIDRGANPTNDVLSAWLNKTDKDGGSLTERQMVTHAILFMITGDEATAITLAWVICALDAYPDVREKLIDEFDRVLGDGPFEFENARKLTYTTCFLKEVERMYSPAFGPKRYVLKSFEFDSYTVPVGSLVRLCNFVSHHMPDTFENPERFDPDRFAPPREEDNRTPYSLGGFGGGPRVCVGRPFSMVAMAVFLATLVRKYDVHVLEGQDLSPHLVRNALFVPKSELQIEVRPKQAG